MDRITEDTRYLIHGLKTLPITVEDIGAILLILGNPENDNKMIAWLCSQRSEPSLEDLLQIAEYIRKLESGELRKETTKDTELLIQWLRLLNLSEEDIRTILKILGCPDNDYRILKQLNDLKEEQPERTWVLEDILCMAEFIRKWQWGPLK